jgi:hypothetical protein
MKHLAGLIVINDGPDWNLDFQVFAIASVASASFAVASAFSAKRVVVTKL